MPEAILAEQQDDRQVIFFPREHRLSLRCFNSGYSTNTPSFVDIFSPAFVVAQDVCRFQ